MPLAPTTAGYMPIACSTLRTGAPLPFDLYVRMEHQQTRNRGGDHFALYLSRDHELSARDIAEFDDRSAGCLYIQFDASIEYSGYLQRCAEAEGDQNPLLRYQTVREAAKAMMLDAARGGGVDQVVRISEDFSRELVKSAASGELPVRDLFGLMEHDYYTFTHVCNVSTYSLVLAKSLGISAPAELEQIVQGAMLHDLGKREIPAAVLNKRGRPTANEWRLIQRHPSDGLKELIYRPEFSWGQLMMVYQHHEKLNGRGYPAGVGSGEIHPWARICAIADVFDALTCYRPYRKPLSTAETLSYLERHAGTTFDPEFLLCWTSLFREDR